MANWVSDYLAAHPELAVLPVAKRAKHSLHLRRPNGQIEAHIVGAPCHYESSPGVWEPIDTDLVDHGNYHQPTGVPIRYETDTVKIVGGSYSQKPARLVRLRPSTGAIQQYSNIPSGGTVSGDSVTKSGTGWTHTTRFLENGVRESLTLTEAPAFPGGTQPTDYICTEEIVTGITFPGGWLDAEYMADGYIFHLPTARDANDNPVAVRRYAVNTGGVQYVYTGVEVSLLQSAIYPLVIDPDFSDTTADAQIGTDNASWDTAHHTAGAADTTNTANQLGMRLDGTYQVWRLYFKFDTGTIPSGATVSSVVLKLTPTVDDSLTDFDIAIVKQDWSGTDPITSGNMETPYDNALTAALDDNIWRNTLGISINTQYSSGELNKAWVNKGAGAYTYYSVISAEDRNDSAPTGYERITIAMQEHATASYRPVLTVVYTSGIATVAPSATLTPQRAKLLDAITAAFSAVFDPVKQPGGGTQYPQPLTAETVALAAAISRQSRTLFAAVSAALTGSTTKQGRTGYQAATPSQSATVRLQSTRYFTGTTSSLGAGIARRTATGFTGATAALGAVLGQIKTLLRALTAATAALGASISLSTGKAVSAGTVAQSANLVRSMARSISAVTVALGASLTRRLSRSLDATTQAWSASLGQIKTLLKSLTAATAALGASISFRAGKVFSASAVPGSYAPIIRTVMKVLPAVSVAPAATATKRTGKPFSAATAALGATLSQIKTFLKSLTAATATLSAELWRRYPVNLAAVTVAPAAGLVRSAWKTLTAATAALSAALERKISRAFSAVTTALSALLETLKQSGVQTFYQDLTAATTALSASLTQIKTYLRALTAATTALTASISFRAGKALSAATVAQTAAITRKLSRSITAVTVALSSSLNRSVGHVLAGATAAWSGSLAEIKTFLKALTAATVAMSASMPRKISKTFSAAIAEQAAALVRRLSRSISAATVALGGALGKRLPLALTATTQAVSASFTQVKTYVKALTAATMAMSAAISRRIGKAISGTTQAISASLIRLVAKSFQAAHTAFSAAFSGLNSRAIGGNLSALLGAVLSRGHGTDAVEPTPDDRNLVMHREDRTSTIGSENRTLKARRDN